MYKGFETRNFTIHGNQNEFVKDTDPSIALLWNKTAEKMKLNNLDELNKKYLDVNGNPINFISQTTAHMNETEKERAVEIINKIQPPQLNWMKKFQIKI